MGSCLAWSRYLEKTGHHVKVIAPNDYPKFLKWLPGNEEVIIFDHQLVRRESEAAWIDGLVIRVTYGMRDFSDVWTFYISIVHWSHPDSHGDGCLKRQGQFARVCRSV